MDVIVLRIERKRSNKNNGGSLPADTHPTIQTPNEPTIDKPDDMDIGTVITDTYAKPDEVHEDWVIWDSKKWHVKYHDIPWERYNQLTVQAMNDTAKNPKDYIRRKQELLLREMIVEIAGIRVDSAYWNSIHWTFGEALREQVFGDRGEINVTEELLKNLMESYPVSTENILDTKKE